VRKALKDQGTRGAHLHEFLPVRLIDSGPADYAALQPACPIAGEQLLLTKSIVKWFWDNYVPNLAQRREVYALPLQASIEQLRGLPPAHIQIAGNDVLRDEGLAYARKLDAAGVEVTLVCYDGMIHDYGTRATGGTTASWLPEIGPGADADPSFDSFTVIPKRIQGSAVISRQLVYQSSPDIQAFIANDLATAISVAVDNAALNGTGVAPQPLGILNYPANLAFSYVYSSRSANVTFGGPTTWANVLLFEKNVELGNVVNDGTFGYVTDPLCRDKWQQQTKTPGATQYPVYLGKHE
jgi:hypothetical protein